MDRFGSRRQVLSSLADAVRTERLKRGWSQRELSRRTGVPQSRISLIERTRIDDVRLSTIERLMAPMGARYWLAIDVPGIAPRRQGDLVHSLCSAHVERRLKAAGWLVAREVEIGGDRSRGWIDLLTFEPVTATLCVIEVKSEIHDVGAIERTMNWYRREAWVAARRLGWRPKIAGAALLVLQSAANDRLISVNRDVFGSSFPVRSDALRAAILRTAPLPNESGLAMIDPRSRRSNWLRPTRIDGRRSAAPYVDYIDFVRLAG
ncbi:MAG TPA: helix-turn-helix domain-containing protein [Candidatus Limnocylindrales bacterium]|nr:helix-turn-helix domain-containing protein [Candidatus Limnocylindrales bacterium]